MPPSLKVCPFGIPQMAVGGRRTKIGTQPTESCLSTSAVCRMNLLRLRSQRESQWALVVCLRGQVEW